MKNNEILTVNGRKVTDELLYEQACKLTNLSQELKLAVDFIDHLCIDSRADKDTLSAFVASGSLSNVTDVLQNIQHDISDISNDICPNLGD